MFNNIAVVLTVGIWQSKVEPAFQGRVFGIMKLVAQVTIPVAVFVMTFISDKVAIPGFKEGGFYLTSLVNMLVMVQEQVCHSYSS